MSSLRPSQHSMRQSEESPVRPAFSERPPSRNKAFYKLPIEMNKHILHFLESDQDIANFTKVCSATRDAGYGDNYSFWRTRFREQFDFKKGVSNQDLMVTYKSRKRYLRRATGYNWRSATSNDREREMRMLNHLRDMILDSYRDGKLVDGNGQPYSPNQDHILRFVLGSRTFMGIKSNANGIVALPPHGIYLAVQIMCAQLLFEAERMFNDIFSFDDSQQLVYSKAKDNPIFQGPGRVNLLWVLHCMSFWMHHMKRQDAHTLYSAVRDLDVIDKPSAWRHPLQNPPYDMPKYWKGTYSYLDHDELFDLRATAAGTRRRRNASGVFEDKNIEMPAKIQELELRITETDPRQWPETFESRLQSLRYEATLPKTRAQHSHGPYSEELVPKSIRLSGEGVDANDKFYASGWLNPLPPQHGIPGWQRVTLMKHFDEDYEDSFEDDLWAYEGVVLPGGRMMVGRWWYASEDPTTPNYGNYSGPFILWASSGMSDLAMDSDEE